MSVGGLLAAGRLLTAAAWVASLVGPATAYATADPVSYAAVQTDRPLEFPQDYGSHPLYRTEWWYITGWLTTARGESLGFQVTFFRTRPPLSANNPSAFTPHQLLVAHCAISDPKHRGLWQDQRLRRAGLGLAEAAIGDTNVRIDDWTLERRDAVYHTHIAGEEFAFDLAFRPTQPPLLNGQAGVSQKGPNAASASYYYSIPHLAVTGKITRAGTSDAVTGEAWLDHEWSSEYLDNQAVGWDWIGIDLDDGGALMAFRIRDAAGAARWAGGSYRGPDGRVQTLSSEDVAFVPRRIWVSPRTSIRYPVEWRVRVGGIEYDLKPLLDDQENDTRLSTGAIYWEGAVRAVAAGKSVGRGYLELTGYGEKLTCVEFPKMPYAGRLCLTPGPAYLPWRGRFWLLSMRPTMSPLRPTQSLPSADAPAMDADALVVHLQAAEEIEKTRLARKLHDELAGLMVSALMDLSFATRQPGFATAGQSQLERAKATLKTAIDVSRRMVEDLRPSMLDNFGLFAALQWELKKASQDSPAVCTQAYPETEAPLDAESSTVLFRVAQEALALIFSRGALSAADLRVGIDDDAISMQFTYDGMPLPDAGQERATQAALASMRHRIKVLGGNVKLECSAGAGCVLTAWMPLARGEELTDS